MKGKIVISAKARPTGEHERRYNEQINLQEVSILTNSEPHDLVLQLRGGGLHTISDLNPNNEIECVVVENVQRVIIQIVLKLCNLWGYNVLTSYRNRIRAAGPKHFTPKNVHHINP